jgi:lipopolysaccharide biosynthesis protein
MKSRLRSTHKNEKNSEQKMNNELNFEKGSFNIAVVLHVETVDKWHKIEQFLNENSKLIFVQKAPDGVKLTVKREVKKFGNET